MKKETALAGQSDFTTFYIGSMIFVTATDKAGRVDICTISHWSLVNVTPPIYGFPLCNKNVNERTFRRYTLDAIRETGEFVINVADPEHADAWMKCGTTSLRTQPELDKFALANLTRAEPSVINTPMIAECAINIECRVTEIISLPDHDWVMGEAVAIHRAFAHDDRFGGFMQILPMAKACPDAPRF